LPGGYCLAFSYVYFLKTCKFSVKFVFFLNSFFQKKKKSNINEQSRYKFVGL
jgi:hypothetical protein